MELIFSIVDAIGDEGITAIAKSLQINKTVTNLMIACSNFIPFEAHYLIEHLANKFSDQGAKAIAEMLEKNAVIEDMDLMGILSCP